MRRLSGPTVLVIAKAPVPGAVKTRLAADLGGRFDIAADLAAAALLDTLTACGALGWRRRISLAGDLRFAARSREVTAALQGWEVVPQVGDGLDDRLAHALTQVPGPVLGIGMDTPQVSADLLAGLGWSLVDHDGVLAPASDGGWWALGLRSGRHGDHLRGVPMSTPTTHRDTLAVLVGAGLRLATGPTLTDVDHRGDAVEVARQVPDGRFGSAMAPILQEAVR
ncbi:MAG: TIGR04282 family arsenosugar biosynthesis glycosyltransferase [Mycobacterium sp.]